MSDDRLARLRIAGFRSLRDVTLEPEPLTVLIGPNGGGKSNVLWALELLRMLAYGSLQLFVREHGGASSLMHYGPQTTASIDIEVELHAEGCENDYFLRLGYGADESLVFLQERVGCRQFGARQWSWTDLGSGHRESRLVERGEADTAARTVLGWLRRINFYHFHDTPRRSPLRTCSYADTSGGYLQSDGSNLPAFLYGLKSSGNPDEKAAWRRISGALRLVAPLVRELRPTQTRLGFALEWVDERGATLGPAHLSDGTLRALALIAALTQPAASLPLVSSIDEPELGLHPAALGVLCDLLPAAARQKQVIVATQSPVILDHVEPRQVIVAERQNAATHLRRLDEGALRPWLQEYSLSELYDKNVLGGRPRP